METTACPSCQQLLQLPAGATGKEVRCPTCSLLFVVPDLSPSEPDEPVLVGRLVSSSSSRVQVVEAPHRAERDRPPVRSEGGHASGLIFVLALVLGLIFVVVALVWVLLSSLNDGGGAALADWNAPLEPRREGKAPAMLDGKPLDADLLAKVKAATVFIKVDLGQMQTSGTGFVIRTAGNSAWIVTNHHVVSPSPEGPGRPDWRGRGPLMPFRGRPQVRPARITVVLDSGMPAERSCTATLLNRSEEPDLAVLRIDDLPNLPAPISPAPAPLQETQRVYFFGFPFGSDLAVGARNPAISVSQGTVSALRRDGRGNLKLVQVECDLNPGNSGGPAIDAQGRLVGIAVAIVRDTNIGLLIHPNELKAVLQTRYEPAQVQVVTAGGQAELRANGPLADPEGLVKEVFLLYRLAEGAPRLPGEHPDTGWQPLEGGQRLALVPAGGQVRGRELLPEFGANAVLVYQTGYLKHDGRMHYCQASLLRPAPPQQPKAQAAKPPEADAGEDAPVALPNDPQQRRIPAPPAPPAAIDAEPEPQRLPLRLPVRTPGDVPSAKGLPGISAYWSFDEGGGKVARDDSGHGLEAKLAGQRWTKGIRNAAVDLSERDGEVLMPEDGRLNFKAGEAFTVSGWFQSKARSGPIVVFRGADGSPALISVKIDFGGWLLAEMRDDQGNADRPNVNVRSSLVNDGQWHHFALVRKARGSFDLWLDGQLAGRGTPGRFGQTCQGAITTTRRAWGWDPALLVSDRFRECRLDGLLDEACVFKRELTETEIKKLAGAN